MLSLDVLLRKFAADTVINCFYPHATHLPVLISSHTEYCVSGMYCHMTLILVRLQVSNVLLNTNILQKILKVYFN